MNFAEYTAAVDRGEFPEDRMVTLPAPFVNEGGEIQNLLLSPMNSVAILNTKKGWVRANHWHKTDWHYSYIVKGEVLYYERAVGEIEIPPAKLFVAGEMFFTPPNVEHAMVFPVDTVFITMAKNVRDHAHHEDDVVRVSFISPAQAQAEIHWYNK